MEQNKGEIKVSRQRERIFILAIGFILALFFYQLYSVIQPRFSEVAPRITAGTMVNLNAANPAKNIRNLLKKGYYFEDQRDINLIESTIASAGQSSQQLENIGEVNKRRYFISAEQAYANGGQSLRPGCWHPGRYWAIPEKIHLNLLRNRKTPFPTLPELIWGWANMVLVVKFQKKSNLRLGLW